MKMNRRMRTWMGTRKGMGVLRLYFAVNWSTSPASLRENEPGPNFSLNHTKCFQMFSKLLMVFRFNKCQTIPHHPHYQLVHLTS